MFPYRRLLIGRRVIVNLTTGKAVEGVLTRKAGRLLEIRNALLHEPGKPAVKVDGAMVIERDRVEFVQVEGV